MAQYKLADGKTTFCANSPVLDGGGWTMVWKHAYGEACPNSAGATACASQSKYATFSSEYTPCTSSSKFCNLPNKNTYASAEAALAEAITRKQRAEIRLETLKEKQRLHTLANKKMLKDKNAPKTPAKAIEFFIESMKAAFIARRREELDGRHDGRGQGPVRGAGGRGREAVR